MRIEERRWRVEGKEEVGGRRAVKDGPGGEGRRLKSGCEMMAIFFFGPCRLLSAVAKGLGQ